MSVHDWLDRTHLGDCRDLLRQMNRDGVRVQTCVITRYPLHPGRFPDRRRVLDPFMGSGTTAMVAARLERRFIGCELNPAYLSLFSTRGVAS
jgi:hypothetical protein